MLRDSLEKNKRMERFLDLRLKSERHAGTKAMIK